MNIYEKSLKELKLYMKVIKKIPSEKQWNRYALSEKLLSSKSIEYGYGLRFNQMCRNLSKEINEKSP